MEVNVRGRYMFVPSSLLDIWYERHDEGGTGADAYERPKVDAYAVGLEFVVRNKQANGIFYLEYINSLVKAGYWDDADREAGHEDDGSWIEPVGFGVVTLGANYGYEIRATKWFSVMMGAGLGVGLKTGDLIEWDPGEDPTDGDADNTDPSCGPYDTPAYIRKDTCPDDGAIEKVPPVLVLVDINLGVRFNISDRASVRVEGGLHDLLYGGATLGITF